MRLRARSQDTQWAPSRPGLAEVDDYWWLAMSGLRRERSDQGVVLGDLAELGCAAGASEVVEELDVGLVEVLPLLRCVVLVEDGLDRADRLAGTTVDALIGVDVERALTLVDAVDRTFLDTGLVLDVDTRLGDHVRHVRLLVWIVGGPVSRRRRLPLTRKLVY